MGFLMNSEHPLCGKGVLFIPGSPFVPESALIVDYKHFPEQRIKIINNQFYFSFPEQGCRKCPNTQTRFRGNFDQQFKN